MKKILFILVLLLGIADLLPAQVEGLVQPVYGWHSYTSHKAVFEIAVLGDSAYAISGGGLIVHNVLTAENTVFSTPEGLSSVDPTAIAADPASRNVYIGYKDGTINYLSNHGEIHVITDIFRNDQFTSKRINHIHVNDGMLYIATDFGVVVYNIARRETQFSVTKIASLATGTAVSSVVVAHGRLWAALEAQGVWSADMTADDPTVPTSWSKESGQQGLPLGRSTYVCAAKDTLYAQVEDTIFQAANGQPWALSRFSVEDWNYLNASGDLVFGTYRRSGMMLKYADNNIVYADNYGKIMCVAPNRFGDVLIGDSLGGLQRIRFGIGFDEVGPPCPLNNNVADIAARDGELYIAPKGRQGSSARAYDKSGIPFFDIHQGGWDVIDHRGGPLSTVYEDFYRVAIDSISGRTMVGSWGEGIVELMNGEFVRDYHSGNSGLSLGVSGHLVGGLAFDPLGNLWIAQALNGVQLQCLTTDGQWYSFTAPFALDGFGLLIDALGNKWIMTNGGGLAVFNDNGTLNDRGDDQWRTVTSDYRNGGLPNNSVFCLAEDHDLQIWIGTSEGVTIMYDPTLLFTNDFQDAACPLIEGYCLFRDQQVNDIVVDGFNRKWIATENGAFLVNLDGTEVLQHFTRANSPLLSDDVRSIAVDGKTGEVFFGTSKGLISYIGDATDGEPNAENLFAYPNPAYALQDNPVMIRGMRRFSKVKIATASGRLVRELDSQGGEVPWDLHDAWGNRVTPGIYLIMVSDPDGNGAGVTKIAILEQQN